jgi:hypothetical protein
MSNGIGPRRDPQLNSFIGSADNSKSSNRPSNEAEPLGSVHIPHVTGVSEKSKRMGNAIHHQEGLQATRIPRSSLMRTRQQTAQCICGRSYTGETGRPLAVRLRKQTHNLKDDLLETSKLVQHAYEQGHRVVWMKPRFWRLKATAHIENTMNRHRWRV